MHRSFWYAIRMETTSTNRTPLSDRHLQLITHLQRSRFNLFAFAKAANITPLEAAAFLASPAVVEGFAQFDVVLAEYTARAVHQAKLLALQALSATLDNMDDNPIETRRVAMLLIRLVGPRLPESPDPAKGPKSRKNHREPSHPPTLTDLFTPISEEAESAKAPPSDISANGGVTPNNSRTPKTNSGGPEDGTAASPASSLRPESPIRPDAAPLGVPVRPPHSTLTNYITGTKPAALLRTRAGTTTPVPTGFAFAQASPQLNIPKKKPLASTQ